MSSLLKQMSAKTTIQIELETAKLGSLLIINLDD